MLTGLRRLIRTNFFYKNLEQQRHANLLMFLATLAISFSFILFFVLFGIEFFSNIVVPGGLFAIAIAVFSLMVAVRILVDYGQLQFASYLFVGVLLTAYLTFFLIRPSANNTALIAFVPATVVVAFLLGPRAMFGAGLVFTGIVAAVFALEFNANTVAEIPNTRLYIFSNGVAFLSSLTLCMVLVYHHIRGNRAYISGFHQSKKHLHNLAELSNYLHNSPSVSVQYIVEMIESEFNYQSLLYLREASGNRLMLIAATGLAGKRSSSELRMLNTQSHHTAALAARRKSVVRTTLESRIEQREDFLPTTQVELAIPLTYDNRVDGVIVLQSADPDKLRDEEIGLWEVFTNQLLLNLQQTQLQQQIKDYEERLGVSQRQIHQYERDVRKLTQEVQGRVWEDYLKQRRDRFSLQWKPDTPVMAWESREGGIARNAYLGENAAGKQCLFVPIALGNSIIGEMVFDAPEGTQWTQKTVDLAIDASTRLGLALDNVRLFDQAQTIAFREQTVGTIAAELQDAHNVVLLLDRAASTFNQVLGTQHTHIRLGLVDASDNSPEQRSK